MASLPAYAERLCIDTFSSAETGTVTDAGGSTGNYSTNQFCQFVITPSSGDNITLDFSAFNYENGFDFLRVYDGNNTSSPLLGTFTGTRIPDDLTATSGSMLIRHSSDFIINAPGFVATWRTAPPVPQSCPPQTVADDVPNVAFNQNTGTVDWTTDWLEIGENDGPSSGIVRANNFNCSSGNCLRLGSFSTSSWSNRGLQREADLSAANSATLSFNLRATRSFGSESVTVAISNNGGISWTNLRSYSIVFTQFTPLFQSFDISAFISSNTRIRFLSSGSNGIIALYADDIEISYEAECLPPDPIADWHFDENGYQGASGEVLDTSTSGFNGRAVGDATTVSDGQVCRASSFDGNNDYLDISGFDTTLRSTATLSYWIRTSQTGNNIPWQAPGVAGIEQSGGTDDIFWGWLDAAGRTGVGPGNDDGDHSASTTAINDGEWHHVAHTRDTDSGELQTYVDGVLENTNTSDTGNIGTGFSSIARMEDTGNTPEFFAGELDEVLIFNSVLTETNIQTVYTNQLAGNNWDGSTRECTNTSASGFVIAHDNAGIHCLNEPITVTAVDSNGAVVVSYVDQITLDTQSGRGTWSVVTGSGTLVDATANDGVATYTYGAADNGVATFALDYSEGASTINVDAFQTSQSTIRDNDNEGNLTFAPSGFTLTANALSNPPPNPINDPITTRTAGTDFAVHITAYGTTPTDSSCGVIETYTGNRSIRLWTDHAEPNGSSVTATVNDSITGFSQATATDQSVMFTAGRAVVTAKYKDAGSTSLHAQDNSSFTSELTGGTNDYVSRPATLVVSQVTDLDSTVNPGATTMAGPGFVASGSDFRVVVVAQDAEGSVTPSFGLENAAESVRLRSQSLVAPAGGRNGSTGDLNNGASFVRTGPGAFTSSSIRFDETGIIRVQAEVADGNYLNTGALLGTISGNIGRFYPDRFSLAASNIAAACNGFTYQGQPELNLSYELQALNTSGGITENYDAALVMNNLLASTTWAAENSDNGVNLGGRLSSSTAAWGNGRFIANEPNTQFNRAGTPDGPFDDLQISVALDDSLDNRPLAANTNASTSGDCLATSTCNSVTLGSTTQIRYGRFAVLPGIAPEQSVLDVPLAAQYFDGSGFRHHSNDNCSTYSSIRASLSQFSGDLSAADTTLQGPILETALLAGQPNATAPLRLSAPGLNHQGSAMLSLDVDSWLEFDWTGTGASDPQGLQQFGRYRGHDRIVYWDEQTR